MNQEKDYKFYVIELSERPYTDPDRYVCIPFSWIRFRETTDGGALVKFPTEELSETKKRVKNGEEFSNDWLIFSADIKYSTDSYNDAIDYIKILNKISIQEQNCTKVFREDMPSTSGMNIFESLPSSEQIESTNPDVEICQEKIKLEGTTNFATKARRYSTRQSLRMSSPTNTVNSLDQPAKKSFQEARDCIKESDKAKNDEETNEPSVANNQYPQLTNESQVRKILRSVLGDDFIKELKKIHSEFKMSYLKLDAVRLSLLQNCEVIEGLIQLAGEISNDSDSGDLNPAVEELENDIIKMNLNKNTIVNYDEAESEIQNNTLKEDKKQNNNSDSDITDEDENYEDKINNPVNKIRGQARKFTLPPEYDPDDSKWTLKHRKKRKDLVELTPHSGVYVDAIKLSNCKRVSSDSKTFARMLLLEIFSESALSVCSLTGKKANAFDLEGTSVRPGLDEHARTVLLNYVDQYAHEQKWVKLDLHTILNSLRNKIQECRGKNG